MSSWRDDVIFTDSWKNQYCYNENGPEGPWKNYLSKTSTWVTRTYRSLSTATQPNSTGEYYLPTNYHAFRFLGGSESYLYWYRTRASATKRWERGKSGTNEPFSHMETYGCLTTFPHYPAVPGAIVSRAESKIHRAIKNGEWNAGQTLGEMSETLAFIALTAGAVLSAYKAVRKGNFTRAADLLSVKRRTISGAKSASAAWLSLQFGWKPMLSDIYNAVHFITDGLKANPPLSLVAIEHDDGFGKPSLYSAYNELGTVNGTFKRGVEVGVTYTVKNPALYDATKMGLTNPLSLAWELLPLSFVVDWFIPIGDFVDTVQRPMGLQFLHGYISTWTKWSATITYVSGPFFQGPNGNLPKVRGSLSSMRREVLLGWPMPVPYWDPTLGGSKTVSIASLLTSAMHFR